MFSAEARPARALRPGHGNAAAAGLPALGAAPRPGSGSRKFPAAGIRRWEPGSSGAELCRVPLPSAGSGRARGLRAPAEELPQRPGAPGCRSGLSELRGAGFFVLLCLVCFVLVFWGGFIFF